MQISVTSTDASSSPVAFDIVYTTALSPLDTDWKPFIVSSTATVHNFTARRGLIYQFRARAIDQVGNVSDFSKIASTTFDQISLNGTQSESERVLTAENSPYLINGNQCYIIPAGTKLTIEAGVEIKIGKYLCIMVNGILDAQGDSDAHITFSQLNPGEYWAQIFLNSATATFNYADITGGDTGGLFVWKRGLVFADNNSYLELNNSTVDDLYEMAGAAVGAKDSVVKIRDSVLADTGISSNCGNNVCNHGIRAGGGTLYLDNVLLRNVVYGIRAGLPGYQSYPVVYSNNFSSIMGENIGVLFMPDNEYFIRTSTPV